MSDESSDSTDNDLLSSISEGAILFIISHGVTNAAGMLMNVVLARTLGPSLYGVYSYSNTIISLSKSFTTLGTDIGLLRFIPAKRETEEREEILGLTAFTVGLGSLGFCVILFILTPVISSFTLDTNIFESTLRIFLIILFFESIIKVTSSVFRSLELPKQQMMIEKILYSLLRLLAVFVASVLGYSILGISLALAFVLGCLSLASVIFMLKSVGLSPRFPPKNVGYKEYYSYSLPTVLSQIGTLMYRKIDVLMVGVFLSSSAVGIYNISMLLAQIVVLPMAGFNQIFPTIASKLYSDGKIKQLDNIYSMLTRWVFTLCLPILMFVYVYRQNILLIFGNSFTEGEIVLSIIVLGQFANALAGPSNYLLLMTNHQYFVSISKLISGVANIVLNIYFILEFGLIGAAIATTLIIVAFNFTQIVSIFYLEGLNPYSIQYIKPVLAGGIVSLFIYILNSTLSGSLSMLLGFLAVSIIYPAILFLLGIEEKDKNFIISRLDKLPE